MKRKCWRCNGLGELLFDDSFQMKLKAGRVKIVMEKLKEGDLPWGHAGRLDRKIAEEFRVSERTARGYRLAAERKLKEARG